MHHSFDIRPWLKPVLTIVLGAILIFKPAALTSTIAWCVGLIIALVGAWRLVQYFSQKSRELWTLLGGVILLVLGLSVLKNPIIVEKRIGQVVGILLILQAVRSFLDAVTSREKTTAIVTGVAGIAVMLMPLIIPRIAVVACGVVMLIVGIDMVLDLLRSSGNSGNSGDPDIIDAR